MRKNDKNSEAKESNKGRRGIKLSGVLKLLAILGVGIWLYWTFCRPIPESADMNVLFVTSNFHLTSIRTQSSPENLAVALSELPLPERWTANLVFKPLMEYQVEELYDSTGNVLHSSPNRANPDPCLIEYNGPDTLNLNARTHRIPYRARDTGLDPQFIRVALRGAARHLQRGLPPRNQPMITPTVRSDTLIFQGIRTPTTAYTLLTVARPARNNPELGQWDGWGPYGFQQAVAPGINTVDLKRRASELWNSSPLPETWRLQAAPLTSFANLDADLVVLPGFPPQTPPTGYKVYQIPYGYTYIAVVLDDQRTRQAYDWLRSLARQYVQNHTGDSVALEMYWIPRGWLRLGRAQQYRERIRGMPFPPSEGQAAGDGLVVGVYVGQGSQVLGINFQNFHTDFFHGADNVVAIGSPQELQTQQVDVLVYKASFDPFSDSPAFLYDFAVNLPQVSPLYAQLVQGFKKDFIDYGPYANGTLQRAEDIQKTWSNSLQIFPLFSEPVTVLIKTDGKVKDLHMNYREGFVRLHRWSWSQ